MKNRVHHYSFLLFLLGAVAGCGGSDSGSTSNAFELAVTLNGPGTGVVTSIPAGIDCGSDCFERYPVNTVVTLTATQATGSLFAGWGGACTGAESCALTMDAARSVTATFVPYNVDCSYFARYLPPAPPVQTPSSAGPADSSVIIMHGKAAAPTDAYLQILYSDLSNAGYDVIAPYMPWSGTAWDGAMCEAMNYVDSLAAEEAAQGNNVVVAGHSMGGAHALIYAVTTPPDSVKAVVALAPGHFPQIELPLLASIDPPTAALVTASIERAEAMVAAGKGDQVDTFDTLTPAGIIQISASASDYLSYHGLDRYPDIEQALPATGLPVLWLAGAGDALTDFYDMPALFSRIPSPASRYQEVAGDHLGMVSSSSPAMLAWLLLLGY